MFSCSNGELNWCQSSSVSLKFHGWLFFFFFSLYVGMKNNNLLGKFCIDTQSRFLVEDQFRVFVFRCQWKFLNDLFHALCQF